MKKLFTLILLIYSSAASAQWSDVNNQFFDSLHMPVSIATKVQKNPIVVQSYPDGGYFVVWEDDRNVAVTNTDIYAQKYDKTGKRLWAENGVPVSNGPNRQQYTISSNQDYRNRSVAATDSAGGFYIAYYDDSVTNYSWYRMCVQHMKSNGSAVFGAVGFIAAQSVPNNGSSFSAPFLIADGNKGFYLSYVQTYSNDYVEVYDYRDENGTMKLYGGGKVNENAIQVNTIGPCGIKTDLQYPGTNVIDYNIWPDGLGGCNVIMSMNGNTGQQYKMLCYNKVWRAKKDAQVKSYHRNETGAACPGITQYTKGNVYVLYTIASDFQRVICGGSGSPLYEYTNYRLLSNGYQLLDQGGYDYNYPKGVSLPTAGNINVDVIAVTKRTYANNVVSDFVVQGYAFTSEKYDSVPYQRAANSNPDIGYNTRSPQLDTLNFFRDTLLATGNYYFDFCLAGGGPNVYAAGLMSLTGERVVRLQHLGLDKKSANSYALSYKAASKYGDAIGKEISTGFSGFNISYDLPMISVNSKGDALFSIGEYYRPARVSPIVSGTQLAWGAMGRAVGSGYYNSGPYHQFQPFTALDPLNGSGAVIAWRDDRYIPGNTSDNVFMRHLDKVDQFNYQPPVKPVKFIVNYYGATVANPAVLYGTSKVYTLLEAYSSSGTDPGTSPIAEISDKNNLGVVQASIYENNGAVRKYNNQPYLDRNLTIRTDNFPSGAKLDMLIYFSKKDFDALKAADHSILTPDYLTVIRQPNTTTYAPDTYTPVAGEELLTPIVWDSVPGGYFVKVIASGVGNFFLQKISTITLCAGSSTTLTSDVTGATYQWQVNTGTANFYDIANNANYAGTTTRTLSLNNLPSSFNGYRYRCVVNNTNVSRAFTLSFLATWTGAVSNAWENPGNWGCGIVPDSNTDVIINTGTVTINSNVVCRSLTVNPGVIFTINPGFKLTITH